MEDNILGVTAITEVLGDGQKVTAVAVEYPTRLDDSKLAPFSFSVTGRTIARVYVNDRPARTDKARVGRFAILELSPADEGAALFVHHGRSATLRAAEVQVEQVGEVWTSDGVVYAPDGVRRRNDRVIHEVIDDFVQSEYVHPETGIVLPYNLYIPKGYDPSRSYPLVTFVHDLGASSEDPMMTLAQGLGAVVWASPEEQAKHECFVLAPQYDTQIVNDDSEYTDHLQVTVDLIKSVVAEYSIDADRLYATGQSGGCMLFIAINIEHPDLLAASYLVAGQWDPALVAPLAQDNLWIIVAEGDKKAFPGMNAITEALERRGARVSRAIWDGRATSTELAAGVESMLSEGSHIMYTVLRKGTVVPVDIPDDGGNNHICTWRIAYEIEGIRDWLFQQTKKPRPPSGGRGL